MGKRKGRRILLKLPWPPSVNNYYGRGRGRVYLKPQVRGFRRDVATVVMLERLPGLPITKPVKVSVTAYPPSRRAYDLDNLEKALFDALQFANVIKDDAQVVEKSARKAEVVQGGAYLVMIEEVL